MLKKGSSHIVHARTAFQNSNSRFDVSSIRDWKPSRYYLDAYRLSVIDYGWSMAYGIGHRLGIMHSSAPEDRHDVFFAKPKFVTEY